MKPWDLVQSTGKHPSDTILVPLWADYKPHDFYFAALFTRRQGLTTIYITPGEYFELFGKMYADSIPIANILPEYLIEVNQSIYEAKANIEYVRADLISKGFMNSWKFQAFIADNKDK